MGQKIGVCIGEMRDVGLFESSGARGLLVKTLVLINIKKPLHKSVNVRSKKNGVFWVDFKYEHLLQFCYTCRVIEHDDF